MPDDNVLIALANKTIKKAEKIFNNFQSWNGLSIEFIDGTSIYIGSESKLRVDFFQKPGTGKQGVSPPANLMPNTED